MLATNPNIQISRSRVPSFSTNCSSRSEISGRKFSVVELMSSIACFRFYRALPSVDPSTTLGVLAVFSMDCRGLVQLSLKAARADHSMIVRDGTLQAHKTVENGSHTKSEIFE